MFYNYVGDLLSLLKWKAHPERIQDTLHKVMKLNGEETVKVAMFLCLSYLKSYLCV